jgi:hypothetical protein
MKRELLQSDASEDEFAARSEDDMGRGKETRTYAALLLGAACSCRVCGHQQSR